MPPATILTVTDLAKTYVSEEIFKGVTFQVAEREHVALVGVNGAGKSTMLRIIAGIEHANAARSSARRACASPICRRKLASPAIARSAKRRKTRLRPSLRAGERMREIEHAWATPTMPTGRDAAEEYDRLQQQFELGGGYDIEHRTDEVLFGLGFDRRAIRLTRSTS